MAAFLVLPKQSEASYLKEKKEKKLAEFPKSEEK